MKHRALNVFAVLAVTGLLVAPMAFGDQIDRLKADIPFDFIVGNKTLPAGTYHVQCAANRVVTLFGIDRKGAAMVMTQAQYSTTPAAGKLIFTRYDNSYFLSQVWRPGVNTGGLVPKSKTEREMALKTARGASTEIAVYPTTSR